MKLFKNELGSVPAGLNASSLNLIALEAFRRGMSLEFHAAENRRGFLIRISDGHKSHDFKGATAPLTDPSGGEICNDKWKTKRALADAGVLTPKGFLFSKSDTTVDVLSRGRRLSYPVVVKPVDGSKGVGVVTDVASEDALKGLVDDLIGGGEEGARWVVEEQVEGAEYRVLVVNGVFIAALGRRRASVKGNGQDSIRHLVKRYNRERKRNPHLRSRLVGGDDDLHRVLGTQGYTVDDVPDEGVTVRLSGPANFSSGGVSQDCTDLVSQEVREASVAAVCAIPGIFHAGVDVIVNNAGRPYVIEINHGPAVGSHHFPAEGVARDVAARIVDGHFPDSVASGRHNIFFNFKEIRSLFVSRKVEEFVLPRVSPDVIGVKLSVSGSNGWPGLSTWVDRNARKRGISGSIRVINSGQAEIIAAAEPSLLRRFEHLFAKVCRQRLHEELLVTRWNCPVFIGFRVRS